MTQEPDRDEALQRLRTTAVADATTMTGAEDGEGIPGEIAVNSEEPKEDKPTLPAPVVVYEAPEAFQPLRLRYPFTIDGLQVDALCFAEPSFSDVEDVHLGRISELEMHARMAGVDVVVLRALKWSDSEMATALARMIAPELRRS